jgi:hypothetical protein
MRRPFGTKGIEETAKGAKKREGFCSPSVAMRAMAGKWARVEKRKAESGKLTAPKIHNSTLISLSRFFACFAVLCSFS